ncbi:Rgp1-domain-containing protein [Tothia fuscella]|uniref:Rgp1-domain-containing protein n=1 Tax=Tothia fuscella TaxID=1048955 RepID=A0A9P4NUY3_9PEZI|nr:Rgp1-domain-containing protein [Tothia fuscella]
MPHTASNIRASVHFAKSTVFAGEDIECTITFTNTSPDPSNDHQNSHNSEHHGESRSRKVTPVASKTPASRKSSYGPNVPAHLRPTTIGRPKHGRSLSIISMGTDDGGGGGGEGGRIAQDGAWKSGLSHSRASSVQHIPRRGSVSFSSHIGSGSGMSSTQHSPRVDISEAKNDPIRHSRATSGHAITSAARKSPGMIQPSFKFPATDDSMGSPIPDSAVSPRTERQPFRSHSPHPPENDSSLNPISRILSEASLNGGSRSSMDLYSMSNHSDETLASEYMPQPAARLIPRQSHVRNTSRLGIRERPRGPETLMMGYAQIMGSFTLDGSLVNQAPFEEVKRKGVVGGHGGGGVVGVERTKHESGLFGALGWNSIGESLGGLMHSGELSSIKEMRGIASSKTIPLVSTPHSVLFVNLSLAPGESRTYSYRFTLPRGLPPTHKGRAMKVSYHLTIGTQRAGSAKEQQIHSVDVPFRVFGSVSPRGETLGHDLMSPYILLRDMAKTTSLSSPNERPKKPPDSDKAAADFMQYVNVLLEQSQSQQSGLLSPTSPMSPVVPFTRRHSSVAEEPRSMSEAIDLAILRSNHINNTTKGADAKNTGLNNKFDIARSGRHVASLLLPRSLYKLGETINLIVSFKETDIPTYAVQVALETSEKVDAAIAMRSPTSIYRYTRKVHAYAAESALFAKRLSFSLGIPGNATPEFDTSGVSLEWKLRIEFVTPRVRLEEHEEHGEGDGGRGDGGLFEEVGRDDRGVVLQGVERLMVETFEVSVPIRVFGGNVGGRGEWDVEGLVV